MGPVETTGGHELLSVRSRVVLEHLTPSVDGGRIPVKRVLGDTIEVAVDVYADGHDVLAAEVLFRHSAEKSYRCAPLEDGGNDRWRGAFRVTQLGRWEFTVRAWVDSYATWAYNLKKKADAGQDVEVELRIGSRLVRAGAARATADAAAKLTALAKTLEDATEAQAQRVILALDTTTAALLRAHPDQSHAVSYDQALEVIVEPKLAEFSAWYEFFPRSTGPSGRHGTFRDAQLMLEYAAELGFDVVYLPPIHPIGRSHRKGPNNSLHAGPEDPGSPWAIGALDGGHKAIHPQLGTLEDFRAFCKRAEDLGLKVAIDIAFQASPDHPYVATHPEWFLQRPDGTIQHAENPPKKYEDIYPFDLSGEAAPALWEELTSVFFFWIEQGVRVFRVDNPHTKPLRFWQSCLSRIKQMYPDIIFLSEAFARPKLMYGLAKVGFSQSYTYFTWRNAAWEFRQYLKELTEPPISEFFRPNFWPNTPDILPEHLQHGGRPAFVVRAALAALLSSSWGIYGPAYELMESVARPGSGEYADSEKYQLRHWNLERPDSLRWFIAQLNRIRRANPALQSNHHLSFHDADNEHLLCFSKHDGQREPDRRNVIVVVVNLNYYRPEDGWVTLRLEELGIDPSREFQVHDLLRDTRYQWRGSRNYVRLDPADLPVHVFRIRRHVRGEHEFEYFA